MVRNTLLCLALSVPLGCSQGGDSSSLVSAADLVSVAQRFPAVEDELVVKLLDPADLDKIQELEGEFDAELERIDQTPFFLMRLPAGTDLATVLTALELDLEVLNAQRNHVSQAPEGGPADQATFGSDLLSLASIQSGVEDAGLPLAAAQVLSTGQGVVVAVVDTGLDFDHPFFSGDGPGADNLLPGRDFIDEAAALAADVPNGINEDEDFDPATGLALIDEQFGHGTFVASQAIAVACEARIIPVRVLDAEGFGTAVSVARGIRWAVDQGADVINVSLGIPTDSRIVKEAVDHARKNDVVVVAAAGNQAMDDIVFPARLSHVLAVAAVDEAGVVAVFSNVGSHVSLVAPGVNLLGAVPVSRGLGEGGRWSGTSFATALAAGAAALVRSARPELRWDEVIKLLEDTAAPVEAQNPGLADDLGKGQVDPAAALGG